MNGLYLHKRVQENEKTALRSKRDYSTSKPGCSKDYQNINSLFTPVNKHLPHIHHKKANTYDDTQIDCYLTVSKDNQNAYKRKEEGVYLKRRLKPLKAINYDSQLDKIKNNIEQSLSYLKTKESLYKEQVIRMHKLEEFVVGNIEEAENRIGQIATILSNP